MKFTSDRQRKAAFFHMSNKFASRPEIYADPELFKDVRKEDLRFLSYPEEIHKLRVKRKPGVVRADDVNFANRPPEAEIYGLWRSGVSTKDVAESFGVSEPVVRTIVVGYGVDPIEAGYTFGDYPIYLREVEELDITDEEGRRLVAALETKNSDMTDSIMRELRSKTKPWTRDADERSEDYVSKGDWYKSDNRYSRKSKGYSKTDYGYECDHCDEEFDSRAAAIAHVSLCNEKEKDDDLNDDGEDSFFSNDDGTFSKRPQAIGSKWKGENYEHGPRIRQPKDFIFMKTVDYDKKYRKFEDGYRLPKDMPRGSKVVIGRLKDGGEWAVQSSLTPL